MKNDLEQSRRGPVIGFHTKNTYYTVKDLDPESLPRPNVHKYNSRVYMTGIDLHICTIWWTPRPATLYKTHFLGCPGRHNSAQGRFIRDTGGPVPYHMVRYPGISLY